MKALTMLSAALPILILGLCASAIGYGMYFWLK